MFKSQKKEEFSGTGFTLTRCFRRERKEQHSLFRYVAFSSRAYRSSASCQKKAMLQKGRGGPWPYAKIDKAPLPEEEEGKYSLVTLLPSISSTLWCLLASKLF
jgi:hypothetical protein